MKIAKRPRASYPVVYDIPVPSPRTNHAGPGRPSRYPWKTMAPGGSFFVPGAILGPSQRQPGETMIQVRAALLVVPGSVWRARSRIEDGVRGVRVWRVA